MALAQIRRSLRCATPQESGRVRSAGPMRLESGLSGAEPPIISRIKGDRVLLDMRTVGEDEVDLIAEALRKIESGGEAETGE